MDAVGYGLLRERARLRCCGRHVKTTAAWLASRKTNLFSRYPSRRPVTRTVILLAGCRPPTQPALLVGCRPPTQPALWPLPQSRLSPAC